ncbi:hypothetical protein ILUMI_09206 [Ignelater luminosus]|uniref:BHLH domain-containing protein n=1 Tax=Ignelater luminosus TaxID=2038154 RepID=A0A8K0GER5_IGNLU|nr:hypothetical protein ILUMI_09206 [Ignelater luminosus]
MNSSVTESVKDGGNIILLSKHSTLGHQLKQDSKQGVVMMDTAKKKTKTKELLSIRAPPPPAVARRNARERNRVKQVNNGFANLRQHIPNSIAAAFESGRSGNKKLSKVETLRMAVEYIRSLEDLLSVDDSAPSNSNVQCSSSYSTSLASPSSDDDNISSNSTPPPPSLPYVKVSGSETYHIVPLHMLGNNEHLKSLKIENDLISNSGIVNFKHINSNSTNPLSPGIYSESSLSPGTETDIQTFIPVFNMEELSSSPPTIKIEESSQTNEDMRILCHNLIMLQADNEGDLGKQLNMNELISW